MFDYYGCKNSLSKHYPVPKYNLIIEPFAGAAGYSMYHLDKNPNLRCLLVEKSKRVYEMWSFLKNATEKDLDGFVDECVIGQKTSNPFLMTLQTSAQFFNCSYMTINKRMASRIKSSVKRMKSLLHVMDRVSIINEDYSNLPNVEATWFIDPPYKPNGEGIRGMGYDKKCGCTSNFIDYSKLGDFCKERLGQVIVCEQEGADWLPFVPFRSSTNSLNKKYSEMVWLNENNGNSNSITASSAN